MAKDEKSELELIKKTLSIDLDETTVDIFSQDLFGEKPKEKEPKPEKESPEVEKTSSEESVEEEKLSWETPPSSEDVQYQASEKAEVESEDMERLIDELESEIEVGELKKVAAPREQGKLDETRRALAQLEKMGEDFMSTDELKKLFQNVNLMIDLLHQAVSRLERLEQKLKEMGLLPDL